MSGEAPDVPTELDLKAGYSSNCRSDRHTTCQMARMRCSCSCHGAHGQQPPAPKEHPVPEASNTGHTCPTCSAKFASPNGLAIHRGRAHPTPPIQPKRTPAPKAPQRESVPDRELLAVLAAAYHDLNDADIDVSIHSAATLIDALTGKGWRVVE